MSNASLLINTLKKALKQQGLRYRDLANALEISEASVKRMFSEENFSLQRLSEICGILGMSFPELAAMMELEEKRTDRLSEQQEMELVSDIKLLLMAFLVINGWKFHEIQDYYHFTEPECIHYLAKLDRLRIIELLPNNRIKLIISPKFSWRMDGPMQQFFTQKMQHDFLKDSFLGDKAKHSFLTAMLSEKTAREFAQRIEELVTEFKVRNLEDMHAPLESREIYSMLLAIRPFRPHAFDALRREKR
jgi:DNA-binding Xre family transcriptional regulator